MRDEFVAAVKDHQRAFGLRLIGARIERLADFYEIVQRHNALLHLVAPMTAEEFAIRHVLESLTLLEYLPLKTRFADVGTGAGLPSMPCLIARDDLSAVLIESKIKKANYLREAVEELGLGRRAQIVNRQFEEADNSGFSVVACRALDKFTEKLPRLVKWSRRNKMLLFGGNNLREALGTQRLAFDEHLMPLSDQRFLFVVKPR